MERVDVRIQGGFMHRRGWRGKWITVYFHKYDGRSETTERMHRHPWKLAISVILKGGFTEIARKRRRQEAARLASRDPRGVGQARAVRQVLRRGVRAPDRLRGTRGPRSLFIGFLRRRTEGENATEKTPEGYAHYTEIGVGGVDVEARRKHNGTATDAKAEAGHDG